MELHPPPELNDAAEALRLYGAPPIRRTAMAPERGRASPAVRTPWARSGALRRTALASLVGAQTCAATYFMTAVLPYHGAKPLELAILVLFAVLFLWVSAGFWTALAGFALLAAGGDRFTVSRRAAGAGRIDEQARTAVVMPVCNEDVERVFAGLRATYESAARTGELERFDFFVLSDSSDPATCAAELLAWHDACRALGAFGRIFYRRRRHRIKRKSGNVGDFCRRWGARYRYMVVLDADSVMSGACLATLVRLMEADPRAGIIQTAPRAAGRETLHARIQQFAARVYGPLFAAGLHFWQLGESHYWGHNAIIRLAPFMRHCVLGRLPGRGPLSGEILSHDFVEAALMRRAGFAVWIAHDLPGSYEEVPPNLPDELKREHRWCRGNLMNARFCFARGIHAVHRVMFATGLMAYASAPLWFLFLALSTAMLAWHTLGVPDYFPGPRQLFPHWPEWRPTWAIGLFCATATLLALPKVLAGLLAGAGEGALYGGAARLWTGIAAELVYSALLAPIRMLSHTNFVLGLLGRWSVHWSSPIREDAETGWRAALRRHRWHTLIGIAWASGAYWLDPAFLGWMLPVVGALILAVPVSVWSSRVTLGRRARAAGLFVIPEEMRPPEELHAARRGSRTYNARLSGAPA